MTLNSLKSIGAAVVAAALLQGCSNMDSASHAASPPINLDDTAWTLSSLPGTTLPPALQVTLQFEGGRATGSDGCNRFGTRYTAANGRLELGPQRVSTQRACPEPASQLATAFNRVLDEVRAYRNDAGSLLLLNAGGAPLATLVAQSQQLAGTAWQVGAYNNGQQAVVSVMAGTQLSLEFLADGTLRGLGGCNRFNGSYKAEGRALSIGRLASTRMACMEPEGRMAQESAFLAALETVTSARREADRLEMRTASGALAVSAQGAGPLSP